MGRICTLEGCPYPHEARGYCTTHYKRWIRHGDPLVCLVGHAWKGDDISYSTAHKRVRRAKGKADRHLCVDCGEPAQEWSYDGLDSGELTETVSSGNGAPIVAAYSTNPDHYHARCKGCHNKFDMGRVGV